MTTKTPKAPTVPPADPRTARPGQAPAARVARPSRRQAPKPAANPLLAWGPLIVVVVVALAAVAALALNPFVVQDKLVKPTPVSLEGLGEIIPAVPPTAAALQQTPVPGAAATPQPAAAASAPQSAAPGPTRTPGFLEPVPPPQPNVTSFPDAYPVPQGNGFALLDLPTTSAQLPSNPEALAIMNQA